ESFVSPGRSGPGAGVLPVSVDVHETDQGYELCAALPGWKPDDINVTAHGDTITISGQHRTDQRQDEGKTYHLRERRFGSFSRSFSFPSPIETNQAQARFEHGELILTIPKAERARPRRIPISAQVGRATGDASQPGTTGQAGGPSTPQTSSPSRQPVGAVGGQGGGGSTDQTEIPVEGQDRPSGRSGRTRQSGT